jgi:hypothetical protein
MLRPLSILRPAFAATLLLASCEKPQPSAHADAPEAAASAAAPAVQPVSHLPEKISFNEHIQPILSEYCYHCHGPDSGTREPKSAPLRLDIEKDAFAPRENGKPVIIKGKPEESLLVKLIHETDPDTIMPPPASHKTLDPEKIALLEKWIEQGAPYEAHWAFIPVTRPEAPEAGKDWAANPIDRFIADKLAANGLKPNPPEDPRRFYRRLHLDLTGLPPVPEAVDAFFREIAIIFLGPAEKRQEHFAKHYNPRSYSSGSPNAMIMQWLNLMRTAWQSPELVFPAAECYIRDFQRPARPWNVPKPAAPIPVKVSNIHHGPGAAKDVSRTQTGREFGHIVDATEKRVL